VHALSVDQAVHHVIDVAATVLEAASLPQPAIVNGVAQQPLHGGQARGAARRGPEPAL